MNRKLLALQLAFLGGAWAQTSSVTPDRAPTVTASTQLQCPTGTQQVGGANSRALALACAKTGADGARIFHGPMISLWASGKVEAVGQVEEGLRTGRWTLYDQNGVKVGQTEFLRGDYHGRRVEFFPTGALKLEETWVNGKRQGPQKSWTETGAVSVAEFRDDRQVTK